MRKRTTIVAAFGIPRRVAVAAARGLAAPTEPARERVFEVAGSPDFAIAQLPYRSQPGRTTAFCHAATVHGDKIRHSQSTRLDLYSKISCDHPGVNNLRQVA